MDEKKRNYVIENFYERDYDSFEPNPSSHYLGKQGLVKAGEVGMTTDPRTANQISSLSQTLNQGAVPVEMQVINPQVFDQIPKQHFEEMKRQVQLSGSKISMHAPLVDPAGMGERGWDESQRELAERQLKDAIDKAFLMKPEDQDLPVTMHAANSSGTIYKMTPEGKKTEMLVAINRETGQLTPLKEEIEYFPGGEVKEETITPERNLKIANDTEWNNSIRKIEFSREGAERIMQDVAPEFRELYLQTMHPEIFGKERDTSKLSPQEWEMIKKVHSANEYVHEATLSANTAFKKAYKIAVEDEDKKALEILDKASKKYGEMLGIKNGEVVDPIRYKDPKSQSEAVFALEQGLSAIKPQLFQRVEDFSLKHASDTFSNVAIHAYEKEKQLGKQAPIVSIENLYEGFGFSQAEDLNKLLLETKKKFVEERIKQGESKSTAQKAADRIIGMTFDMGHANIAKGHGFKSEDIVKEAEALAKHIKHIHVTDNFGYSDSHLPPGMGNVPVREILETLEKKGVKARKINEVGGWFEHFKTSPFQYILESGGSPLYSTGTGPYWSHATGFQQGYSVGYGMMLPSINYQTFGAGFSQLPQELGGQIGGQGNRMSGRPME